MRILRKHFMIFCMFLAPIFVFCNHDRQGPKKYQGFDHVDMNVFCFSPLMLPYLICHQGTVKKLQRACLRNPVKIEAAQKYSTVDTLKQHYRFVAAKNKMSGCTSMVFTRTCDQTRLLSLLLRDRNVKAVFISGQMTQANRLESLNKFKSGQYNVLVCTDVAGRGLDIPSVDMVHIHQVGRTARAGRSDLSISRVNQYELDNKVTRVSCFRGGSHAIL